MKWLGGIVRNLSKYEKILILIFLLTLPFVNPWVRGDGVGYYAFARAPLIQRNLDFRNDWIHANTSFRMGRFDLSGDSYTIDPNQFTSTGHLDNHFSVGPAILWMPFLSVAHGFVTSADTLGARIPENGFSKPYLVAMALGTAFYGFAALWVSFRLARKLVSEEWAFAGTLGIWFASSLPVYMYFNPSWSHAQSAFVVALFLWYWLRTLESRSVSQWLVLGLMGGIMMDVYYINCVLVVLPVAESMAVYVAALRRRSASQAAQMLTHDAVFSGALVLAFLPTLITKKIIYGSFLNFGYTEHWYWNSPAFFKVAFSSDHGFLTWTPVLILSLIGLVVLTLKERKIAFSLLSVFILYVYAMGCYEDWDGISSFGNRFFVSLTPIFVIGLAAFFAWLAGAFEQRKAACIAGTVTATLIAVNFGVMFQWGMHLIPPRGPISYREAAYNEVAVVPGMAAEMVKDYLTGRGALMKRIEQEDVKHLKLKEASDLP
ncbi:MAG TPA: glycosyltransferase family 39 protein [Candidatus Acidoferrales bacterium]|nr:glycosyltransferase family 39 protein [Candidatus Acidoferrales bacterium]